MDLENLKNTWKEEEIQNVPEVSTEKQLEISNPISRIKKNIKMELWSSVPICPFAAYVLFRSIQNEKLLVFSLALVLVSLLVWLFFAFKMLRFSKEINSNDFSSFQHLLELEYQMKYYKVLYQSYYIAFVPILFCEIFLIIEFDPHIAQYNFTKFLLIVLINLLFSMAFLYVLWALWYNFFYGRHIKKIKSLIRKIRI